MNKWLMMAGIALICGIGALFGAFGFQALWALSGAGDPSVSEPAGVWHEPEIIEVIAPAVDTGRPTQELADIPATPASPEPPPSGPTPTVIFLGSDGPNPEVDRQLLGAVADWSPCAGMNGTVGIVAMSLDGVLTAPMVLSDPMGNEPLEACTRAVIEATSAAGAPADYFMLSARVALE